MTENELFALINKALPGSVFLMLAPMEKREPYVIYSLISGTPNLTLRGDAKATLMNYRIDAYARTRRDALAIMRRIFELVDSCDGDPMIESRQDLYEQDTRIHRVSVVLSTTYDPDEEQTT
ncbi:tail completion protein gp17 [Paraburkholderia bannensis]|uniref:tail completion protein gp17 n=1 Tax=Paraburkholderia bannensis TaxID=765414 RepID=UPI002AC33750|nr:hypothetical protein [Paraburkholderia bannensis]